MVKTKQTFIINTFENQNKQSILLINVKQWLRPIYFYMVV